MSVAQDTGDSKANPNMQIWDAVAVTPPSWTKRVQEGPRSYTTINAYRQIATATRQFGPVGTGWGWEHEWEYHGEGEDTLVVCHLTLWYETRVQAVHVTTAGKLYMGKGDRCMVDDDCYKKILTDALTKALSYLGFNADVYYGRYDDNKYVQAAQAREQAEATGADGAELPVHAAKQRIAILMRRMGLDLSLVKDALHKEHGVDALDSLDVDAIGAVIKRIEAFAVRLTEIQSVCDALAEHGAPRWKAVDAVRDWAQRRGGEGNPLVLTDDELRACLEELQADGEDAAE